MSGSGKAKIGVQTTLICGRGDMEDDIIREERADGGKRRESGGKGREDEGEKDRKAVRKEGEGREDSEEGERGEGS